MITNPLLNLGRIADGRAITEAFQRGVKAVTFQLPTGATSCQLSVHWGKVALNSDPVALAPYGQGLPQTPCLLGEGTGAVYLPMRPEKDAVFTMLAVDGGNEVSVIVAPQFRSGNHASHEAGRRTTSADAGGGSGQPCPRAG